MTLRPWILFAALAATGVANAGNAQVRFIDPDRYTDADRAGFGLVERQRTLDTLQRHIEALAARHLPADATLTVEVLDVDLAGDLRPRAGHDTRVLKGGADVPRLQFRYRLQRGGTVLAAGEERLTDLGYLDGPFRRVAGTPLPYEQRLLARWFEERRFGGTAQRQ